MKFWLGTLTLVSLTVLGAPAGAHHALQSEFDINNPSHRWTGTLKTVQWINPHVHFVIDVTEESGKVVTWTFETAAPNGLRRIGFSSKGFFEVGRIYTFVGYPARDGSALAFLEQITFPDGRNVRIWFGDPNGSN